jgi:carbon monoxide dehydrogenase subunit G
MIDTQRKRLISAPAGAIREILVDATRMSQLMPRVEQVEVQGATAERARITLSFRLGKLGLQRVTGEARMLEDGMRFVAVSPVQVDAHWTVQTRGDATEVIARLRIDLQKVLGAFSRFVPRRLVEQRIGQELETSLDALERLATQ